MRSVERRPERASADRRHRGGRPRSLRGGRFGRVAQGREPGDQCGPYLGEYPPSEASAVIREFSAFSAGQTSDNGLPSVLKHQLLADPGTRDYSYFRIPWGLAYRELPGRIQKMRTPGNSANRWNRLV